MFRFIVIRYLENFKKGCNERGLGNTLCTVNDLVDSMIEGIKQAK